MFFSNYDEPVKYCHSRESGNPGTCKYRKCLSSAWSGNDKKV